MGLSKLIIKYILVSYLKFTIFGKMRNNPGLEKDLCQPEFLKFFEKLSLNVNVPIYLNFIHERITSVKKIHKSM
jgi:hypothetical protein